MPLESGFTQHDFEIVERVVTHRGHFMDVVQYRVRFKLFADSYSQVVLREVMERKSAVAILPYDPVQDQVILIEQFRAGVISSKENPWLLEIVAGIIEQDETPEQVAIREAQEEANCAIHELIPLYNIFVSPGGCNEALNLFIGRVVAKPDSGFYGLASENEDIRPIILSSDEAFALLNAGKIKTPPAIIALQWLQTNKDKLRTSWQTKK